MPKVDSLEQIDGKKLAAIRIRKGFTQEELAPLIPVSKNRLSKWETQQPPSSVGIRRFKGLAEVFKMTIDELRSLIGHQIAKESPAGIDPNSFEEVKIPTWPYSASATRWAEMPLCELNPNNPEEMSVIRTGLFRLSIDGDCMEPVYQHGSIVEFKILHPSRRELLTNRDYIFCRSDGMCTFKYLSGMNEESYILAAWNQDKYPGTFEVNREEVVRVAGVVGRILPPPLIGRPLEIRKK